MDHEHGHGMVMTPPPSSSSLSSSSIGNNNMHGNNHHHNMMMTSHMTFYWGKNGEILFSGWPGTTTAMYALAMVVVFLLALLVEWFAGSRLRKPADKGGVVGCIQRTLVHALRMGLAYLLMLAVMSFNVGVFLVVILGHAIGYWVFGSATDGSLDSGFPH